eukprot:8779753-Pyramimonas_sp.AAC.1
MAATTPWAVSFAPHRHRWHAQPFHWTHLLTTLAFPSWWHLAVVHPILWERKPNWDAGQPSAIAARRNSS